MLNNKGSLGPESCPAPHASLSFYLDSSWSSLTSPLWGQTYSHSSKARQLCLLVYPRFHQRKGWTDVFTGATTPRVHLNLFPIDLIWVSFDKSITVYWQPTLWQVPFKGPKIHCEKTKLSSHLHSFCSREIKCMVFFFQYQFLSNCKYDKSKKENWR